MKKRRILAWLEEYITELCTDQRNTLPQSEKITNGPESLQNEIRNAIKKMKHEKAAGIDQVSVEMIVALDDLDAEKVTNPARKIYITWRIMHDLAKSVILSLPKPHSQ